MDERLSLLQNQKSPNTYPKAESHFKMINRKIIPLETQETKGTHTEELVHTGLTLAGKGLQTSKSQSQVFTRYSFKMKNKNFSADDVHAHNSSNRIETSNSKEQFNPKNLPTNETIDKYFNELLEGGTFFWGSAQKNLQTMTYKRKWELICKMNQTDAETTTSSLPPTKDVENAIKKLNTLVASPKNLSKSLYQLERMLRQTNICQIFHNRRKIEILVKWIPQVGKDDLYVFLRCFKTMMNNADIRISMLDYPELLSYLCSLVSSESTSLRCRLQASDILLLLTYIDNHSGYEVVWKQLRPHIAEWLTNSSKLLSSPEEATTEVNDVNASLFFPKMDMLISDYFSSMLFLINSIVQGFQSFTTKKNILAELKRSEVYTLLYLLEDIDCNVIQEQVKLFKDTEENILEVTSRESGVHIDSPYGSILQQLTNLTSNTQLEPQINSLLDLILKSVNKKTYSESSKLLQFMESFLQYSLDNSNHNHYEHPETLFQESVNNLMDSLQSDEIAKRAMLELDEKQSQMNILSNQLTKLRNEKTMDKSDILDQLKQVTDLLESKDREQEKLILKAKSLEDSLREEKRKYDQYVAHNRYNESNKKLAFLSVYKHEESS